MRKALAYGEKHVAEEDCKSARIRSRCQDTLDSTLQMYELRAFNTSCVGSIATRIVLQNKRLKDNQAGIDRTLAKAKRVHKHADERIATPKAHPENSEQVINQFWTVFHTHYIQRHVRVAPCHYKYRLY